MRWLVVLSIVLATMLPASAENWTTADGKTYKDVTVLNQEEDGVRITYLGGVGKIPYYQLPVEIQKRFGQDVDSLAAKKSAADQVVEAALRNAETAEDRKQQDDAAAALQKNPQGTTATQATGQPGAAATVQPGATALPGAHGQPGQPAPSPGTPLAEPQTPNQPPPSAAPATTAEAAYPGSKLTYNDSLDVCYLDSPAVTVWPDPPPAIPNPAGQGTSLTFRIVTDGRQPQAPDKIEATFLSVSADKKLPGNRDIVFSVDGTKIAIDEKAKKDNGFLSGTGQIVEYVSFYLTPAQAKTIINGQNVQFSVGSNNYKIDFTGTSVFQKYFADVDHLPPSASSLVRTYLKFLSRVPSWVSIISTVCEYIVLGSFTILVAASIAAFVMGISRFIKM